MNRAAVATAEALIAEIESGAAAGTIGRTPIGAAFLVGAGIGLAFTQWTKIQPAIAPLVLPGGAPVLNPAAAGWFLVTDCRIGDSGPLEGNSFPGGDVCGDVFLNPAAYTPGYSTDGVDWYFHTWEYGQPDEFTGLRYYEHLGQNWRRTGFQDPYSYPAAGLLTVAMPKLHVEESYGAAPREPDPPHQVWGDLASAGGFSRGPPPPRQPPKKNEKVKKSKVQQLLHGLLKILEAATELIDAEKAFFAALPKECRDKAKKEVKKAKTAAAKKLNADPATRGKKVVLPEYVRLGAELKQIYACWKEVDVAQAIFNLIWQNMVEDFVWGQIGFKLPKQIQKDVFGPTPGAAFGRNIGYNSKHSLEDLRENDQTIPTILKDGKDFTSTVLNTMFPGLELDVTPEYAAELSNKLQSRLRKVGIN